MNITNFVLKKNSMERRKIVQNAGIEECDALLLHLAPNEFAKAFDVDEEEVFVVDFISTIMSIKAFRSLINSTYATSTTLSGSDVNQSILCALYAVAKDGCDWMEIRNKFFAELRRELQVYKTNPKDWNNKNAIDTGEFDETSFAVTHQDAYDIKHLTDVLTKNEISILIGDKDEEYDVVAAIKVKAGYATFPTESQINLVIKSFPTYGYRKICSILKDIESLAVTEEVMKKIRTLHRGQ